MQMHKLLPVVGLTLIAGSLQAQTADGPVISGFGAVYEIPHPGFVTPKDHVYRVVFDVAESPEAKDQLNRSINSVARFLNMHAQAGVPVENMQLALVLHGGAAKDALDHEGYRRRFGVDNPNLALLEALESAGVEIYLCGQSASSRGLLRDELSEPVSLALSAMTVVAYLQNQGYAVN